MTDATSATTRQAEDKLASASSALKAYCFLLRHAIATGDDISEIADELADLERPHLTALDEVGAQLGEMVEVSRRAPDVSPRASRIRQAIIEEQARKGESAETISHVVQLPSAHVERIMQMLMKDDPAYAAKAVQGRVING